MTILYLLAMLGVLIFVHELGHMLMAKAFHIYVREFAIGFGPKIWQKQGKETKYTLRCIPLGGFTGMVEMPNDNHQMNNTDEESTDIPEEVLLVDESRTFYGAAIWKRILVLLAGPAMNLITAAVLFISIFAINGYTLVYPKAYIESVLDNSPAAVAGLQHDDLILSIQYDDDHTKVQLNDFYDLILNNALHEGSSSTYTVLRGEQQLEFHLQPVYSEENGGFIIGITSRQYEQKELNFAGAVVEGIRQTYSTITSTVASVVQMVRGTVGLNQMSGTVGMYSYTKEAVSYGFTSYLSLCATISVSLGMMNLLPISVLDGGRVVLCLAEGVVGHRLNQKLETAILLVGWILIMGLFVVVTFNDILKLFA